MGLEYTGEIKLTGFTDGLGVVNEGRRNQR